MEPTGDPAERREKVMQKLAAVPDHGPVMLGHDVFAVVRVEYSKWKILFPETPFPVPVSRKTRFKTTITIPYHLRLLYEVYKREGRKKKKKKIPWFSVVIAQALEDWFARHLDGKVELVGREEE